MKTIKLFQILSIMSLVLLSSCSNKFSLTKRHYSKGYYFAHSKKSSPKDVTQNKIIQQKGDVNNIAITKSKKSQGETPLVFEKSFKENTTNETKNAIENKKTKVYSNSVLSNPTIFNSSRLSLGTSEKNLETSSSSSGEGRSLLWVVIIVLIILWALGLISGGFGIGVLINLLLLIALILLVLWLLRII